jgi:hypothetical protein
VPTHYRGVRPGREQRQRVGASPERDGAASPRETREFPAPRYALAGGVLGRAQGKRAGLQNRPSAGFDSSATCQAECVVGVHRDWFTIWHSTKPSRFDSGMYKLSSILSAFWDYGPGGVAASLSRRRSRVRLPLVPPANASRAAAEDVACGSCPLRDTRPGVATRLGAEGPYGTVR